MNPFVDLRDSLAIFSAKARESDISYLIYIDPSINECLIMDKIRMGQILTNLVGNAIKFTPDHGTVEVRVERQNGTNKKENILFSVRDTGIGIPEDRQDKIFQSFVQADSSTTRNFGGTGLGLSISASLCQLMGGKLKVESKVGEGSRFYFELSFDVCQDSVLLAHQIRTPPIYIAKHTKSIYTDVCHQLNHFGLSYIALTESELLSADLKDHILIVFSHDRLEEFSSRSSGVILIDDSPEAFALAEHTKSLYHIGYFSECPSLLYNAILELNLSPLGVDKSLKIDRKKLMLKVLVADDYEINRILVDEMLKNYNIQADFAVNGREAVEKATQNEYDLIFMDINMPELNGMDATIELRKANINIPIIALTANALEGDREKYIHQGMDDYISKPIDVEMLDGVLMKYAVQKETASEDKSSSGQEAFLSINDVLIEEMSLPESSNTNAFTAYSAEAAAQALLKAQEKMSFSAPIMKLLFVKFLTSCQENIAELIKGVDDHNIQLVSQRAHAIRGMALSLRFNEMGELCNILEYGDKENKHLDYLTLAKHLEAIISSLVEQKEEILQELEKYT